MINDRQPIQTGPTADPRATTAIPVVEWEILTGAAVPPGQRVLRAKAPFGIYVFPMTVQEAQQLGRALSAPGVVAG